MKIEQKEIKDNFAIPIIKEEQIQENIGYNCSECSSMIEIISINDFDNSLEFKCINNDKHNNKLNIHTYLEKMKKYKDKKNLYDKCEKHDNNEYQEFCFSCKSHICLGCLKSKMHKTHNKKSFAEDLPSDDDINKIKNKIKLYYSQIKDIKESKKREYLNELNNNKINEYNKLKEEVKNNKIKKLKELKLNKTRYINDINEIKRKYEREIKLRKIEYDKEINNINNKFKNVYVITIIIILLILII